MSRREDHLQCCRRSDASPRRRRGVVRVVLDVALAYLLLVGGAGMLKSSGHPVAVETGRLVHTVLMVEPTLDWMDRQGWAVADDGRRLANADW